MTTADVLKDSLALLREGGWIKGRFIDGVGRCVSGALAFSPSQGFTAPSLQTSAQRAWVSVAYELFPERGQPFSYPSKFNDHPDTTFADIEAIFEKAILQEGGAL